MRLLTTDLPDALDNVARRLSALLSALRRTTPPVFALRLVVFLGLFGGYLVAQPPVTLTRPVLVALLVAALAAALPRTRVVGLALVVIALLWVLFVPDPSLPRALVLATLLYLAHAAAAFAAVLPYDCAVSWSAMSRWATRQLTIVAVSLLLGAAGILLVGRVPTVSSIVGPIVGSLVAAAIAGLLAWQLRRRDPSSL